MIACLVPFIILPYYCTIGGWVIKYFLVYLTGHGADAVAGDYFTNFIRGPVEPIVLVAFLAAVMIIPAVYTFMGPEALDASGPSLMFVALPKVFDAMGPVGHVVGALFFLLVFFAAITSSVSVMEAIVSILMEQFGWTRKKAAAVETVIAVLMALIVCLGYNKLYFNITLPNGASAQILDVMDYLSNSIMMPVVAIGTCVLIGWVTGPETVIGEIEKTGCRFSRRQLYVVMARFIAPVLLTVLLLKSIGLLTMI